ncbi:MAG: hypothetical protein F6K04_03645, partial [Leptolyngbya sp. SIO4C5]|nr:hypothetical protein [Leptolyngbya sp. SIO4C5]
AERVGVVVRLDRYSLNKGLAVVSVSVVSREAAGGVGPDATTSIALIATLLLLILGRFDLLPLPNQPPAPNPESPRSAAPDQATEVVASGPTPPAASLETTETETTASPLFSEYLSSLTTTPTLSALEQGQQAIAQQRYAEAIRWLEQVPAANRDDTFNRLQEQAEAGLAQQVADNQARIELARQTVQPEQAASLEAAIAQVNPIPPGEPFHQEAQQLVEQWSQSLLDLANAAANAGDLTAAIAAASFIPAAATDLYPQAQTQIGYWQARQLSQARLQQAQTMLQPGQAASFQDAIGLLRQIPAEHPEYEQAQARIDQLSQEIFSIARARAAQGRFEAAIQAAVLVPPDTAAYNGAQAQLKRWQER